MLDKLLSKWKPKVEAQEEVGYLVQCWECWHVAKAEFCNSPCDRCGGLVEALYVVDAAGHRTYFAQGQRP